jgi:hypothetical protein
VTSAIENSASVNSLIANPRIRPSRFPAGRSYTEARLLEHPPHQNIPGHSSLFEGECGERVHGAKGNMTNMSSR